MLECCCTDVSEIQSVFPVREREGGRLKEEGGPRDERGTADLQLVNSGKCTQRAFRVHPE